MTTQINITKSSDKLEQKLTSGKTSFVQRLLEVAVKLTPPLPGSPGTNQPNVFADGTNTVTFSGYRISVRVNLAGAPTKSTANVSIYGLKLEMMNQLATLGLYINIYPKNTITITAGDAASGLTKVFAGTVQQAYADFNSAPDVPFIFECIAANLVTPTPVSSYPQSVDVANFMANIAKQLGLTFDNDGVDIQLPPSYFSGDLWTQVQTCAEHANINAEIVDGGTKLAIWPKYGYRTTVGIPLVSKETGMIGYPTFTPAGIIVKTLFDPRIKFGGLFKVQSTVQAVNNVTQWAVNTIDLVLESRVPNGQWMMMINAWNPRYSKPVAQPVS